MILHDTVQKRDLNQKTKLLKKNVYKQNVSSRTLQLAFVKGYLAVVEYLLKKNSNVHTKKKPCF